MRQIYLDNNATTALDPRVLDAMKDALVSIPLNPSSTHAFGQEAKKYLTSSKEKLAHALHVKPSCLTFTSGGTEAINYLLRGYYALAPNCHIITSNVEHPAVIETLSLLEKQGASISYLPAGLWGALHKDLVEAAITPKTRLITLTAANNITGVETDLTAIAELAQKHNLWFVVDGVQLLGKKRFHIPNGVSAIAFAAHKLHGPTGIGLAIQQTDDKLPPLIVGGPQEQGRRAGTPNLPGIVGFAKAAQLLTTELPNATEKMQKLRDRLTNGLLQTLGNIVVHGLGPRLPNTAHIAFPGISAETLLMQLDLNGIAASHGSACASGAFEPSPTLLQMGIPLSLVKSSIRFSLSRMTTEEEIDLTIEVITSLVK
jgi:cysteine desulfurase